jgi:hypothetical protein
MEYGKAEPTDEETLKIDFRDTFGEKLGNLISRKQGLHRIVPQGTAI